MQVPPDWNIQHQFKLKHRVQAFLRIEYAGLCLSGDLLQKLGLKRLASQNPLKKVSSSKLYLNNYRRKDRTLLHIHIYFVHIFLIIHYF